MSQKRTWASGKKFEAVQPGLRRMEHGSHVVFYRAAGASILVLLILHKSMLPRL
jgi:plasmid stabilization system protein ParE